MDCGLVDEVNGILIPTPPLDEMLDGTVENALEILTTRALVVAKPAWIEQIQQTGTAPQALEELLPDPARREELLIALGRRFDDEHRRLLGEIGEEIVVSEAREELEHLGYGELARSVRRVSLESDQLGYDISAPRLDGSKRLLEVKATTTTPQGTVGIHLSRNEARVGDAYPEDWALVVCLIADVETRDGAVVGWCSRHSLEALIPEDAPGGRWEQAWLGIPQSELVAGLPLAFR